MRLLRMTWVFTRFLAAWVNTLLYSVASLVLIPFVGPTRMWLITRLPWGISTLWLLGVKLEIEGVENLKGPGVFICNHQSLIDVVFLPAILPRATRIVAKREILFVPFWGWAFAMGGAVLIDRRNPRAAIQNIRKGLKRLPKNWSVIVFPEGTRSLDGKMRPFKKGAFHIARETGLPIVPIGMDGAHDIVPLGGWLVRPGVVRVVVGKPIPTDTWTQDNLQECVAIGERAVGECVERAVRHRAEDAAGASDDETVQGAVITTRRRRKKGRHLPPNAHSESRPLASPDRR